jgi:hypothetical protein
MRSQTSFTNPVIVDFGIATITSYKSHLFYGCGTLGYIAP